LADIALVSINNYNTQRAQQLLPSQTAEQQDERTMVAI